MRWIRHHVSHIVVVGLQSRYVDRVGQHLLDQLEEGVSMPALRVEWVQKRPCPLLVAVEPIADRRQDNLLSPAGDVYHDSTAVATCFGAVGFHEAVLVIREGGMATNGECTRLGHSQPRKEANERD